MRNGNIWTEYRRRRHWANNSEEFNPYDGDKPDYTPSPSPSTGTIAEILDRMEEFYDTPYVWGGSSLSGADCSFFVNYCYGTVTSGTHGINSEIILKTYSRYATIASGVTPKDGMILWKSGHVALYKNGYIYEMASSALNFQKRSWESQKQRFQYILYDPSIDYDDIGG